MIKTRRLQLRYVDVDDATFILELINSPGWLEFIGDKKIRTPEASRNWIRQVIRKQLRELGYTALTVLSAKDKTPLGVVSLVKRVELDSIDIGYAFLPQHMGNGYAYESTTAVLDFVKNELGFDTVFAIVQDNNHQSIRLLDKLDFTKTGTRQIGGENLDLYQHNG